METKIQRMKELIPVLRKPERLTIRRAGRL